MTYLVNEAAATTTVAAAASPCPLDKMSPISAAIASAAPAIGEGRRSPSAILKR
jgi:hypothetical protein